MLKVADLRPPISDLRSLTSDFRSPTSDLRLLISIWHSDSWLLSSGSYYIDVECSITYYLLRVLLSRKSLLELVLGWYRQTQVLSLLGKHEFFVHHHI